MSVEFGQVISLSANTSWYLYNFRNSTINLLQKEGFRVLCLSPDDGYGQKLVDELDCEWQPLRLDNQGSNPLRDLAALWQLYRAYRQFRPQVALHFTIKNNVYGTWAARLLKIPAINNVSGLGTAFIRKGFASAMVRLLSRLSMPLAFRVFCQNAEDRELLVSEKLVPATRLVEIPGSGVDLDRFNPQKRRTGDRPFRFLFAGRMLADKGLFELLDAVRAINSQAMRCELWLCGFADVQNVSAISNAQLQEWSTRSGVAWLGSTDHMEKVYAEVDAVVLPSYREGLSRTLLEAAAMSLPLITTDVPGCRQVVKHGDNGFLCEAGSSKSLQHAMERLMNLSKVELSLMGSKGRELVAQEYDVKKVETATLNAIKQAIAEK